MSDEENVPVDPFGAPVDDDVFGSSTAVADEIAAESVTEAPPTPDLPVVDKEGDPVVTVPVAPNPVPQTPDPVAAPEEAPQAAPVAETVAPPQPATAPPAPPVQPPTPPTTGPASAATGPRGGTGAMRHYKLLYMSGPDQWTQVDLSKVAADSGVVVCQVQPEKELADLAAKKAEIANGATGEKLVKLNSEVRSMEVLHKELWFEARNNEHANRLGFAIMGRPKGGAMIFPVPRGAWKPKSVKPAPPRPDRERVVIS